jgi:hypothetical protein
MKRQANGGILARVVVMSVTRTGSILINAMFMFMSKGKGDNGRGRKEKGYTQYST